MNENLLIKDVAAVRGSLTTLAAEYECAVRRGARKQWVEALRAVADLVEADMHKVEGQEPTIKNPLDVADESRNPNCHP